MGQKIIKLTESDLEKIIKRVISEQKNFVVYGKNPEGTISIEKGKKVLNLTYQSNPSQKFVVDTQYPATDKPKAIFILYKGNGIFELGDKKIQATIVEQIK